MPMILGIGFDLTSLPRIESMLRRYGARFIERILTEKERDSLPSTPAGASAYLAGRFAAKEAAVKALGTGFSLGIGMHDAEILSLPSGKPELVFHRKAAEHSALMGVRSIHISISHERDTAGAIVILES